VDHLAVAEGAMEEYLMCVGCKEEWYEMQRCVEEGCHIATNPDREFVVPCFCNSIHCDKGPHFAICVVDDEGELKIW
jgi:hypothetical protein